MLSTDCWLNRTNWYPVWVLVLLWPVKRPSTVPNFVSEVETWNHVLYLCTWWGHCKFTEEIMYKNKTRTKDQSLVVTQRKIMQQLMKKVSLWQEMSVWLWSIYFDFYIYFCTFIFLENSNVSSIQDQNICDNLTNVHEFIDINQ